MNEALQNLEIKVENGGTTPQGRLTSSEWNILVAAVKALDIGGGGSGGGSVDPSQLEAYLKPYAKTADVVSTYATIASLSAVTSRLNDFLAGSDTDAIINKWSELETFLAGLAESDDLATILSGKANKATTLAGYGITDAYTKSHIDSNFVTIGTKQEITGEKDFVGGFKVNGGLVEYNATLKTWVFNGDLLVTGGMAAFSNISGFKPSTITDAVLIDDRTIKRNADGFLYAVAQGAGGINEDQLADYLTTNGYATQDWVTGRGYFLASNFTKANIKNTLGISDWALASAKPTYTASEVGALMQDSSTTNADLDTILDSKTAVLKPFFQALTNNNVGSARKGVLRMSYNGSESQLLFDHYNRLLRYRTIGANPKDWATIAFTSDIPTKLSQLTDDVVSGKYLPITGGTVNGILSVVSVLRMSDTDGTYKILLQRDTSGNILFGGGFSTNNMYIDANVLRIRANETIFSRGVTAPSFIGSLTGNADSATTLKTSAGHLYARAFNVDKIVNIGADATFQGYSTYIDGVSIRFRYGSANATAMQIGTDGNVAIGGTTATDKLYVYGAISSENANADAGFRARGSAYSLFFGIGSGNVNRGIYDDYHNGWWIMRGADKTTTIDGSMVATGLRINQTAFDNGLILNRTVANAGVGIMCKSNGIHLGGFGINGTKTFEISGDNGIVAQVSTETGNTMIIHGAGSYKEGIRLANRNGKTSTWSGIHLGCDPSATEGTHSTQWLVGRNGNNNYFVVRNNTTDYLQIDLSGNLFIKGALAMNYSSDERLKKNIRKVNASEVLMSLGGVWQYEYIDSEVQRNSVYDGTHFGLIYQNVKGKSLDKMCHKREDGMGALNYVDADFISIIAGATMENISEVEKLKKENKTLRKRVEQLEKRIA